MTPLPVRYGPGPHQPIDDWLEHLASDNSLTSSALCTLLRDGGGTTRFLPVLLDAATTTAITDLTTSRPERTRRATLQRFDGTGALDLHGLDTHRWSTWRRVAVRGWISATGTTACPRCLVTDGAWNLAWRLATTTVCARHGNYLIDACPNCRRRFLDHPHTALRAAPGVHCLNPIGHRDTCEQDVTALAAQAAPDDAIERQHRHDRALAGEPVAMFGSPTPGRQYLTDTRALAVLLLHLARQPGAETLADWAGEVRPATEPATRWHLHPPAAAALRSTVLTCADHILTTGDLDAACDRLHPWLGLAPSGPESRLGWLADHTRMTPGLTRLVMAALAPHRRTSHALAARPRHLDARWIPQVLPNDLYRDHAATLFTTREYTPRLFLSLCLARRAGATTWADAATLLGLDPEIGTRTARAISARTHLDATQLIEALDAITNRLDVDYTARAATVGRLTTRRAWFDDWCTEHRPGTRHTSHRYAVTWLWEHWAHALSAASPGWTTAPDRYQRALYRQFAASLRRPATTALVDVAHRTHREENL
ncbi:TniQ family protein [Isoptericola aurantiacus]|uniref:TniQ family protein n=1 Tax=Isoptericola aurantiacus TaxID=3377839 RepID=UPI00383B1DAA